MNSQGIEHQQSQIIVIYRWQWSMTSVRHNRGINLMGILLLKVRCIICVNRFWKLKSQSVFYFLLYYYLFHAVGKATDYPRFDGSPNYDFIREKNLKVIFHLFKLADTIFPVYKQKKVGKKIHLILSLLKTCWIGLIKKRLIWGWVIIVIPILCRSWWISLSIIYIFPILIVLTHPWQ